MTILCHFTDFGLTGPYVGQMRAAVAAVAPDLIQIDLMHDAPTFAPRPSAYLLAALVDGLPAGATVCAVVDPGVGSHRGAVLLEAGGRRFVGPDNGLLSIVAARDPEARWHELTWVPDRMSDSFHGRDLFAPAAARWTLGDRPESRLIAGPTVGTDWPADLAEVIYIDHYGNCMTGLRGGVARLPFARCRTFSEAGVGEVFWYENSSGLAEIAVNQGSAAETLGLRVGSPVGN